jgi:serine/threonine protein kinase
MEYQEGGTLGDKLEKQQKFAEEDARIIIAQLLLTVDFMSRNGIIHRDLKPENILLNSKQKGVYEIRIADFGFAMAINDEDNNMVTDDNIVCGTAGYIAPEALEGKGYVLKSDIFSVGSILYSMLSLRNLFTGRDYKEIMIRNRTCCLDDLDKKLMCCSPESRDLVRKLLARDPALRPDVTQALAHPWFTEELTALKNSLNLNKLMVEHSNATMPKLHQIMSSSLCGIN